MKRRARCWPPTVARWAWPPAALLRALLGLLLSVLLGVLLNLGLGAQAHAQATTAAPAQPKPSAVLEHIRQRGYVVVGVKTDYPPFGMLDAQGQPEGFEHDLAANLAQRLGVALKKVSVTGANRLQRLEEGAVDVVIATTGDTLDRRRIATMVEPNYYASGVTLFMRPGRAFKDWAELRGQPVCATQGSYYNRPMAQRYLLNLVMFNTARDAKLAVRDGRCVGYLFDNTAIQADLARPEWRGFQAPLPPVMSTPWAIAIARSEQASTLEQFLGDMVADWHRSGFLIERERAWGLAPAKFLQDSQALWLRQDANGQPLCRRPAPLSWPAACRNPVFVTADQVGGLHSLGLWLRETLGVDLSIVYDDYDRGRFLRGLATTIGLMLACVLGSLGLGTAAALCVEAHWPPALRWLPGGVRLLAIYSRMTPPLLQMYLWLLGVGGLLWASWGWSLPPALVAVACLSIYTGAAVMVALLEAADLRRQQEPAFWLHWGNVRSVVAWASEPVIASLVNVCKATMMASALAVPELLSVSTAVMTDSGNVPEMMNVLLLSFLLLIALAVRLLKRFARWLRASDPSAPEKTA